MTIAANPAHAQMQGTTNSAPAAEKMAVGAGNVDLRTGRYAYSATDLSIGGKAPGALTLTRTLANSVAGHSDPFANFSHEWEIMLIEKRINLYEGNFDAGGGVDYEMRVQSNGLSETFRSFSSSTYYDQISANPLARLTWTGDRASAGAIYTYTGSDGTLITFRAIGGGDCSTVVRCAYASEIVQPDGVKFTLAYDSSKRLTNVVSSRGYALLLEYSGATVTKACVINLAYAVKPSNDVCPGTALATTTYAYVTYSGAAKLASVTYPGGNTASFTYAGSSGSTLMGLVKPGQSTPWLTNTINLMLNQDGGYDEIVTHQSFADGQSFTYYYDYAPEVEGQLARIAGGRYADAEGNFTYLTYDFPVRPGTQSSSSPLSYGKIDYQTTPGPVAVTDALGRTTTMDYCDAYTMANLPSSEHNRCLVGLLQSTTDPEGIRTEYSYALRNVTQVRRKAKPGSGLADVVTSATYDCTYAKLCAKPVTTTDARGSVTNYTYDPAHGGTLTTSAPAAPNGIRPVTRFTYGERYTWLANGSGGYSQSATPIWVVTEERFCRTTATSGNACAGGTADEVVTAYDYGPNSGPSNLLLRGKVITADGTSLRICYGYDRLGNQISETGARAGLTACP